MPCMSSNGLYIDVANCEMPFSKKKMVSSIVMMYKEIPLDSLVAGQFRSCDDSFERLQLFCLYIIKLFPCNPDRCGKLYNCKLPNESSHGLNSVTAKP